MKKICLTLFIILSAYQFSMAQWTTSGTNIYYNSGNVAIGTTTPDAKLVVAGSGIIENLTNTLDQDLKFSLTTTGAIDKYALIAPSTATNLAFGVASLEKMRITNSGYVGIGTTTPGTKLDVNGAISMQSFGNISSQRSTNNNYTNLFLGGAIKDNNDGTFTVIGDGGSNYFAAIRMDNGTSNLGTINFYTGPSTGGSNYTVTNANLASNLCMTMTNGNVAIGTTDPKGYKFAVNGNAIATSMTVKLNSNWPDYVFKKDYQLPSLEEVKTYIDQNHHLPEMPSEDKIAKDGVNLGEMNKLLVKKMEELTLYLIEKDNKDKEQTAQLTSQQEQINKLKGQIELLIKNSSK